MIYTALYRSSNEEDNVHNQSIKTKMRIFVMEGETENSDCVGSVLARVKPLVLRPYQ